MNLGAEQVTVLRAALVADRYGQQRDWPNATSFAVRGVNIQASLLPPFGSVEEDEDREYTASHLRLFAPPGTDIAADDRVIWRGQTFDVDGDPVPWYDQGRLDHIAARIKRLVG
jgi:head-tail adaptor